MPKKIEEVKPGKEDEEKVQMKAESSEGKETPEEEKLEEEKKVDDEEIPEEEKCRKCKSRIVKGKCSKCGFTAVKGELGGENPQEDTASATDANSSTSPNMGVPSSQQVLFNPTGITGNRNASSATAGGIAPSDVSYAGKSAENEFQKSPLYH